MHCTAKVINGVLQGAATGVIDQRVPDCSTMDTSNLPIRQYAADILAAVAKNDVVVVIGETGSGKTTQLSQVISQAAAAAGVCRSPSAHACSSVRHACRFCWRLDMAFTVSSASRSLGEW